MPAEPQEAVEAADDTEVVEAEIVEEGASPLDIDLPDDPEEAVAVLAAELVEARRSAAAHLDDLQRVAAEFENYRKRAARERDEIVLRSSQRLVEGLLPVLDSFDQAFTHEAQSPSEELLLAGMQRTYHQLMDVLTKEGLAIVPGEGEPFDPTVHEAVAGGGNGDLVVAQEMRRGYTLHDRVIRPAMVMVSEAGDGEEG
jgi:molecular chaperone GrpE